MTTQPPIRMVQMLYGGLLSQLLAVAAELRLADLVTDGPVPVDELAVRTGSDGPSLHRVLRALAAAGVFTEVTPGTFGSTPLAETLRTDDRGSLRDLARLVGTTETHRTLAELSHSVRTGRPAFDRVHGADWWSYLDAHPELSETFHAAMGGAARQARAAAVEAYDLSDRRRLVDVGGGHGYLVAALLQRYPELSGVVFDRPEVVTGAGPVLAEAGVDHRAELVAGDFFGGRVPADGDAYLLSWILHDWDDERAVEILLTVRRAMPAGSELIVFDTIIPSGDEPHPGKLLDIVMLAQHTGRERTEAEFRALLTRAGLTLVEVRLLPDTPTGVLVAVSA
ncbi:methyltransferase [Plantactinospora sp. S1510]|uniref:Methyltransferase n=1 Tax=Plantactinospora alkalitolerans TaxID=2789879 RepID=A0ABS0H7K7_9ACTN|nr:methyltransferase [Plantactinospora alkalitolerans]MBF9134456.1 methyltransferase [Plantactinospora alkalitolerans]